ncbi:Hypothetical predicted protein [Mytilus galloprovincialis]|uniref:Fucolectin tachylectin-4 pentraxin-1 domain-containing protein n=1 Tax=Mytilus galloprovincialis TaxID=29158 RepID=A0A8B6GYU5_MYTGA|nr:Hypothetical predicted protein [Mytilus galloprovincialis]
MSSAYQIIESDEDLYKTVTNDINNLERKMDKKFEKMMTILQQSIENKCSKEIIGPVYDAAKGKVAKQSSLYQGKHFPASLALDGNTGTFSHTNGERNPSWWVDLGRLFRVVRIEVYSRRECCDQYIFEVSLHGKHTEQSSNYLSSFPASNAIDGNLSTFSHTLLQTNPFWVLDLGTVYKVKMIKVFARTDCCGNYIHDMDIIVGPTTNNMTLCTHYTGPASTKEQLVLKCKKPVDGRFVKLSISATARMALAEVKVFAFV